MKWIEHNVKFDMDDDGSILETRLLITKNYSLVPSKSSNNWTRKESKAIGQSDSRTDLRRGHGRPVWPVPKYIIQERALPDVRDGLKPVQRRILFAMNQDGNTYDKGFRKSAKSVRNVMGNYHPHGDSSIYEAMVRLSQDWKLRAPLIQMHGNNGSMDGDPPAAMRYTEARLSKISKEMLADIDKETVDMVVEL